MKVFTTVLIALTLTACGMDDQLTDEEKQSAILLPESNEPLPDFRGWQVYPNAKDECLQADQDNVLCKTEFQGLDENCSDATFKFIAIKAGYMYVQTMQHVFIRQGEPHSLTFDQEPEVYNITDQITEKYYHVFQCYGINGEVVILRF